MANAKITDGSMALNGRQVKVITIEATKQLEEIKLRVAAYARVSSSSEDQLNSFAAQNQYYTELIAGKDNWHMVDIYADEGITGTSALIRSDFQRMMADCRRGRIDRILVKSLSRFARNTTECLESIRELKSLGVSVFFEKENMDTTKMNGEMLTAIYASFAQSESESISSNMRWSYQKRMQSGQFITCKAPFGYRLENGMLKIEESEAAIVQMIYNEFLSGKNTIEIADILTERGIPTQKGKHCWHATAVSYILRNEKYIGDARLQKMYSTETFPIQRKMNYGERQQYYVTATHPAILDRSVYEKVQALLQTKAAEIRNKPKHLFSFTRKIECGECGTYFQRKMSGSIPYWMCHKHSHNRSQCTMMPIPETEIEQAFIRLYCNLKWQGEAILQQMIQNFQAIRNRRMLWSEDVIELNKQISDLSSQNQMLTMLKKQELIDPDIFIAQTNELTEQLRAVKLKKERLMDAEGDNTISQTKELLDILESGPDFLVYFDAELFGELIEKIIADSNEHLRFRLKNGLELPEVIERTVR